MRLLYIIVLLLFVQMLKAQPESPSQVVPTSTVETRPVSEQQWQDASGSLDYSDDHFKERKPKESNLPDIGTPRAPNWSFNTELWGNIFQVIAIILAVLAIAFGVYKMLQQPRNRALARDGVEITLDNLEDYIHETDLDKFLRAALSDRNYALAIRLYYLQIIKDLSAKNAIRWSREKTNRDYLIEMRRHPLSEPFRAATLSFERVWYGNLPIDENGFRMLEPQFKQLITRI
ncbi:MAG: DUF4129 domain-containing protein [Saprospiraceae bacterium]